MKRFARRNNSDFNARLWLLCSRVASLLFNLNNVADFVINTVRLLINTVTTEPSAVEFHEFFPGENTSAPGVRSFLSRRRIGD